MNRPLRSLLAVSVLCLAGLPPARAGNVFKDPAGRFSIAPPEGFLVTSGGNEGADLKLAGPSYGEFAATITIFVVDIHEELAGRTVDDYVKEAQQALLQNLEKLEILSQRKFKLGGAPAFEVEYRHSHQGRDLVVLQTIVVARGSAYVLTGTTLNLISFHDLPAIRKSIESFRVLPPKGAGR